ncbi:MAG: efflux RND transporter periplasmic adaptor subunit [Leptospirales bacterium]
MISIMKLKENKIRKNLFMFFIVSMFAVLSSLQCEQNDKVSPDVGYYTCAMHPQVLEQEPGNCPICGMELTYRNVNAEHEGHAHSDEKSVEGEQDEHGEHNSKQNDMDKMENERKNFKFYVAGNLLANANMQTASVVQKKIVKQSAYSAHIDFNEDPNKLVIISTKYDGWVEKLFVSKEGQWIKKGQTLVGVYSPQILAAKEEYLTTYSSMKAIYASRENPEEALSADPTLNAARRKLRYLDVSAGQIKKIETTGEAGRLTYYHSPIGGLIVKKEILQGAYIKPGQEIFRIANLGSVWAFIHIFDKDLRFVKKGQKVRLRTLAYPDLEFTGKIDLIYPFLDKNTKDIKVRIVISNPGYRLKPGMFAEVEVLTKFPKEKLTIPDSAVIYSGSDSYVFVSLGEGRFELRKIKVSFISGNEAILTSGLKKDELVVVNGQFLLDSEASLKEAISKGQVGGHQH